MIKKLSLLPVSILLACCSMTLHAQEQQKEHIEEGNGSGHQLTIMMAHAHIPASEWEGANKKFVALPAWGLNYDYHFNHRWAVGVHSDVILQQYKIKAEDHGEVVERAYPVALCGVVAYKPVGGLSLVTGFGEEIERNESFAMMKIGAEYGFELPKNFELSFVLEYTNKFNAYDSWLFGIGLSKIFHHQKKHSTGADHP